MRLLMMLVGQMESMVDILTILLQELWEELVNLAKQLVNSSETELESAWENFPVEHWRRKRVRVNGVNFHLVPHPGEVGWWCVGWCG